MVAKLVKRKSRVGIGPSVGDPSKRSVELDCELGVDGQPCSSRVTFDVEVVHMIRWDSPVTAVVSRLPSWLTSWSEVLNDSELQETGCATLSGPASCTLVTFPMISFQETGETRMANPQELCVLVAIFLNMTCMKLPPSAIGLIHDHERNPECAKNPERDIEFLMNVPDITGARVIHSLQLASAVPGGGAHAAAQLVYTILTFHPQLMVPNHLEGGPVQAFKGENCLHIAAVNKQERMLCAMINLAASQLSEEELMTLLSSKCEGPFFQTFPQCFYGGSVLGFAATHRLKKAVILLVGLSKYTGGLNASEHRENGACALNGVCTLSGFLPLHAAVACGMIDMIEFLTTSKSLSDGSALTFRQRANPNVKTFKVAARLRRQPKPPYMLYGGLGELTPLQLSVKLGHLDVFRHLLRWHHTEKNWEWGEMRSYKIKLGELDADNTNSDVLNLCTSVDADQATKHMISEEFMTGFIWDLFLDKWRNYGSKSHLAMTFLNVANLACLVYLVFSLKPQSLNAITEDTRRTYQIINYVLVVLLSLQLFFEFSYIIGYTRGRTDLSRSGRFQLFVELCINAKMPIIAGTLNSAACSCLFWNLSSPPYVDEVHWEWGIGFHEWFSEMGYASFKTQLLWTFLSGATFCQAVVVNESVWSINSTQGVFFLIVVNMLKRDLLLFAPVFVTYIGMFWILLYSLYPGAAMQNVAEFNSMSPSGTLKAMIMLAIAGDTFDIELFDDYKNPTWGNAPMLTLNFWLFMLAYLIFIAITAILLLNLLIARMNSTYELYNEESEVEWRNMFARRVLRLETNIITKIIACIAKTQRSAGEPDGATGGFKKDVDVRVGVKTVDGKRVRIDPTFFNIGVEIDPEPEEQEEDESAHDESGNAPSTTPLSVASAHLTPMRGRASPSGKRRKPLRASSASTLPNTFSTLPEGAFKRNDTGDLLWCDPEINQTFGAPYEFGMRGGWCDSIGDKPAAMAGNRSRPNLLQVLSARDSPAKVSFYTQEAPQANGETGKMSAEAMLRAQLAEQELMLEKLRISRNEGAQLLPVSPDRNPALSTAALRQQLAEQEERLRRLQEQLSQELAEEVSSPVHGGAHSARLYRHGASRLPPISATSLRLQDAQKQ